MSQSEKIMPVKAPKIESFTAHINPKTNDNKPATQIIPVISQHGYWVVHRSPGWHTERSWASGAFGVIPLDANPDRHYKACEKLRDRMVLGVKTDYAAKAPKLMKPKARAVYQTNLANAIESAYTTYAPVHIFYRVSFAPTGMGWPSRDTILSKSTAEKQAKCLNRIIPPDLSQQLFKTWDFEDKKFPKKIHEVLGQIFRRVNSEIGQAGNSPFGPSNFIGPEVEPELTAKLREAVEYHVRVL